MQTITSTDYAKCFKKGTHKIFSKHITPTDPIIKLVRPDEKEIINRLVTELFCKHDTFIRINKPRQKKVDCFLSRCSNVNLGKRNCPNHSATNGKSVKRTSFYHSFSVK